MCGCQQVPVLRLCVGCVVHASGASYHCGSATWVVCGMPYWAAPDSSPQQMPSICWHVIRPDQALHRVHQSHVQPFRCHVSTAGHKYVNAMLKHAQQLLIGSWHVHCFECVGCWTPSAAPAVLQPDFGARSIQCSTGAFTQYPCHIVMGSTGRFAMLRTTHAYAPACAGCAPLSLACVVVCCGVTCAQA